MQGRIRYVAGVTVAMVLGLGAVLIGNPIARAASPLEIGDVLISIGSSQIEQHKPDGTLVQTLDGQTAADENDGMCFDSAGNLYSTNGFGDNKVAKFGADGSLIKSDFITTPSGNDPESCVVDASGNIFVGSPDGTEDVLKYDSSGTLIDNFDVQVENRGSDWIDLAADQCTLFYTSEGSTIFRYNTCTKTQLPDFATNLNGGGDCFALRLRANNEVMVACDDAILRLDPSGNVVKTITRDDLGAPNAFLFAMNLDRDGTSFWTADYDAGQVVKATIADGTVLGGFTAGGSGPYGGLAVVGELTQGIPTTTTTTVTTTAPTTATTVAATVTAAPRFTG